MRQLGQSFLAIARCFHFKTEGRDHFGHVGSLAVRKNPYRKQESGLVEM
jgi:hypothetical protein